MTVQIIVAGRYDLSDYVESLTLEDSLEEIALCAQIKLVDAPDLPSIEPGWPIEVKGTNPADGDRAVRLLSPGVVWECQRLDGVQPRLSLTAYDKTIYLAKSEDERLVPGKQTATQRLKQYAKEWGIPVGNVPDTRIALARDIRRLQSIFSMIIEDLKETAAKEGDMYRPRVAADGLTLVRIGGNETVWSLDVAEETSRTMSLEGTVTQVKVMGAQESEHTVSKTLVIEKKDTAKYGTLQKVVMDAKIETPAQARSYARKTLSGLHETYSVTAPESIPTIRAGDRVQLGGKSLIVIKARHQLGEAGRMELDLATESQVRRDYFA